MSQWCVVWHYRDLRVEDHPALHACLGKKILPLYIHTEKEQSWGLGAASKWWLHNALQDLQKSYREKGSCLIIRKGSAKQVFTELLEELSIESVFWHYRYEPDLQEKDRELTHFLQQKGVKTQCFEGNYLITPAKCCNKQGKPYSVFTPFSKNILQNYSWRTPLLPPQKLPTAAKIYSDPLKDLSLLPEKKWADPFFSFWDPTRKGAIKKLEEMVEKEHLYAEQRDFAALNGTSCLSPYLHFGQISPHEIWEKIGKKDSCFLRQLLWREFANYFLFHFPTSTDQSWKEQFIHFPWQKDHRSLLAWQKGMTGYPIVDAGMRQLWKTGWMHNRVRMIVGSFLVKHLLIHWIEGARWFWDTLLDADLANNTLGWQWIAGSGPDAAPYFRIFNPILQAKKFDPEGVYIQKWVPELRGLSKKEVHFPWDHYTEIKGYPNPIVDHAEARKKALAAYQSSKTN